MHNRIAWAQGGQSDQYYLSVEIETKNSAANQDQLRAASKLFRWVVGTFNVPPNLATGFVGKSADSDLARGAKAAFDPITTRMCADAGVATTKDAGVAAAASGLSCHYWLHPVKPCPGKALLAQMAEIAKVLGRAAGFARFGAAAVWLSPHPHRRMPIAQRGEANSNFSNGNFAGAACGRARGTFGLRRGGGSLVAWDA